MCFFAELLQYHSGGETFDGGTTQQIRYNAPSQSLVNNTNIEISQFS